jgi:hypothetical protein
MVRVFLFKSPKKDKKYRAVFYDDDDNKIKHTDFGAKGMSDFTIHKDEERKERFLNRFRKLIEKHKDDQTKPITLSTMVLWNKPTLKASWSDYKKHFNLQ